MMFMRKSLAVFLTALAVAAPAQGESITIFAASSMKTALDQVIAESGLDAIAAYGGSATIARQLAQGAEADIVILAHNDWMDWLEGQGALQSGSRCDLLGNELVLAGPANSIGDHIWLRHPMCASLWHWSHADKRRLASSMPAMLLRNPKCARYSNLIRRFIRAFATP